MEERAQTSNRLSQWFDYLFGRNALIGIASLMLLTLSGYATWSGMSDFILGVQNSNGSFGTTGVGTLSISTEVIVIAVVVALTFLMWLALRETFGLQRRLSERLITFPLYLFLFVWSVGFGYGFWWSLIAGQEATRASLSGLQEDARDAASVVAARLDAVRIQLDNVVTWSEGQMQREEISGGSCGRASGAGRGPLYNARKNVRDSIATLRDGITQSWLIPVQQDLTQLQKSAAQLEGATIAERKRNFELKAAEIRGRARNIAARSNELGKSTASEMRALANAVSIEPGNTGFSCYDPTLALRLRQAAEQSDQPAQLDLRTAAFNEGAAGVANAVKNLWTNLGTYLSHLFLFIVNGGNVEDLAQSEGSPITGRDLIALLATLGIDLGLLALTALNPPVSAPLRRDGLAKTQARIHIPTNAVIRQITKAIETAISRAPDANLEWVRQHFIHHDGTSYFVIPNLYSADKEDKKEQLRALAMNQLAGVLDDLNLVRVLSSSELKKAQREEERESLSMVKKEEAIRNHGILSKSRRALEIAGWSQRAQMDLEVFRLVDTEGLTPILTVLNEASNLKKSRTEEQIAEALQEIRSPSGEKLEEISQKPIAQIEDKT